jgi:hypothetical protein
MDDHPVTDPTHLLAEVMSAINTYDELIFTDQHRALFERVNAAVASPQFEPVPAHVIAKVADALDYQSGQRGGDWFMNDCANALRGQVGADGSQFDPKDCRCLYSGTGRHTFVAPDCKLAAAQPAPSELPTGVASDEAGDPRRTPLPGHPTSGPSSSPTSGHERAPRSTQAAPGSRPIPSVPSSQDTAAEVLDGLIAEMREVAASYRVLARDGHRDMHGLAEAWNAAVAMVEAARKRLGGEQPSVRSPRQRSEGGVVGYVLGTCWRDTQGNPHREGWDGDWYETKERAYEELAKWPGDKNHEAAVFEVRLAYDPHQHVWCPVCGDYPGGRRLDHTGRVCCSHHRTRLIPLPSGPDTGQLDPERER